MSITKTQIIEAIKALPQDEFDDIDDVLNEMITISKIEKGLQEMHDGKVLTENEIDRCLSF